MELGEPKQEEPKITFKNTCQIAELADFMLEVHKKRFPDDDKTIEDSKERIKGFLEMQNATELVLRRDGELIGCAFSFEEIEEDLRKKCPYADFFARQGERVFQIKGVNVKLEYRGQGFGKMIMEEIMSKSREKGATKLILSTFPEKDNPARRLYEKLGFREAAPNQDPRSFYMQYEYPEEKLK